MSPREEAAAERCRSNAIADQRVFAALARIAAAMSALTFASARLCAAASASKPSPCTALARDGPPERVAPPAVCVHRPDRLDERRLARDRVEALHVDASRGRRHRSSATRRDATRGVPSSTARSPATVRAMPSSSGAAQRLNSSIVDAVRRDLHDELGPVDRGAGSRPGRRRRVARGAARRRPSRSSRACRSATAAEAQPPRPPRRRAIAAGHAPIRVAITSPPRSCREGAPRDGARDSPPARGAPRAARLTSCSVLPSSARERRVRRDQVAVRRVSSVPARARQRPVELGDASSRRSSPICSSGSLSSFLMMLPRLASIACELARNGRQLDRRLRPVERRRRRVGEEVEARRRARRSAGCPTAQLRADAVRDQRVDQLLRMRRRGPRPASQVDDLDAEPLAHRGGCVTGTENSKRLARRTAALMSATSPIGNAAELDRRAGREPAHRLLEDERVGLRVARAAA